MNTLFLRQFLMLFTGIALSGCIAGTQVRTAPEPGAPVAEKPEYCVGDTWTWADYPTRQHVWKAVVTDVLPDGSTIVVGSGDTGKFQFFYDNQDRLVKKINMDTGNEEIIPSPPRIGEDYPLFVGKRWEETYSNMSVSGTYLTYRSVYTVTAYEKVRVEAGEFFAFRIWESQTRTREMGNATRIYYFVPEIKGMILEKPDWRSHRQVIEYSVSKCGRVK